MAASVDGDIRLSVGLDTSSIESQLKSLMGSFGKNAAKIVENNASKGFDAMTKSAEATNKQIQTIAKTTDTVSASVEKSEKTTDGLFKRMWKGYTEVLHAIGDMSSQGREAFDRLDTKANQSQNKLAKYAMKVAEALRSVYVQALGEIDDDNGVANTIEKAVQEEKKLGEVAQETNEKINNSYSNMSAKQMQAQLQMDKAVQRLEQLKQKQAEIASGEALSKIYEKNAVEVNKAIAKLKELEQQKELLDIPIQSNIYATMVNGAEKAEVEMNKLIAQMDELDSKAAQRALGYKLEKVVAQYTYYQEQMKKLEQSGQAYVAGPDTKEYREAAKAVEEQTQKVEELRQKQEQSNAAAARGQAEAYNQATQNVENQERYIEILKAKQAEIPEASKKAANKSQHYFGKAFDKIKNLGSKMVNGIKGFFNKIKDKSKDSANSMDKFFKHGFRNILKYALGVRSFYFLFRKIRSAAKEALTAMAVQFPEVNAQLSELKNSFIQLKGSVGTLVQPLLQALAPALTTIINLFSEALSVVGSFFALLTGQKFIYKAKKGVSSFAAAQDESTGATKKNTDALEDNQKQLGNYDKLNIIDQQRDKAGAGGGGGADGGAGEMTFEKVSIDSQVKDFMDRFKDAWKKGDLTEIGTIIGTKLRDALDKIPWNKIQAKAEQVGKNLGTLIAGFIKTPGLAKSIGNAIGQALNTLLLGLQNFIGNVPWYEFGAFLADMLSSAFTAKDKNGTTLIGNIAKTIVAILNAAIDTIKGFADKMQDKWAEIGDEISQWIQWAIENIKIGDFMEACASIINGIVTVIYKIVSNKNTWKSLGNKVAEGINKFFKTISWSSFGNTISEGLKGLADGIIAALDGIEWETVGNAIYEFLAAIDWFGILGKLVVIIAKAFWGVLKAAFSPAEGGTWAESAVKSLEKYLLVLLGGVFVLKKFTPLVSSIGTFMSGLFSSGIANAKPEVESNMMALTDDGVVAVGKGLNSKGTLSKISGGLSKALKAAPIVAAVAMAGLELGKTLGNALADDEGPIGDWFRKSISDFFAQFGVDGTMMTEKQYKALQERAKAAKEAVEAELKPITKLLNNANKSLEDSNKSVDAFNKKIANIESGGKSVEGATKTFNELSKKTHLTAVETAALKSASATLAKKYPELNKYMDKNNGILKVSHKQLEKVTNKTKIHKKAVEAQKDAETLYANQAPLKKALEDAQKAYDDAYKKMEDYRKVWKKTYDDWNNGLVDDAAMAEANKKMQGYATAVIEAQNSLDNATDAQKKNNEAMKRAENLINRATIKTKDLEKADATLSGTMDKLNISEDEQRNILADLRKKLDDGTISWKDYKEITGKSYKSANELRTELGKLDKTHAKPTVKLGIERSQWDKLRKEWQKAYEVRMKVSGYAANEAAKKILAMGGSNIGYNISAGNMYYDSKKHKWIAKATGGIFTGSGWHNIEGYAKGGSPKSGQFFMARENGIPELVGTIKNHTAVMNNGQIVASVASGVYQAVASVAKVILPYVRSQTHAMNWLAQNGLQLPDITIGNILPSNSNFLNALRDTNTTTNNITNGVDYEMLVQAFKEAQTNQPIVVQMPNGKVLAEVVWDEEQKKYKQARSTTLQTRYA